MVKNLISLKKLKRISIFLLIFLLCFTSIKITSIQKNSDNKEIAQIPEKTAIVNSNNPPTFSPTSFGNSKSIRNLYESNLHGGSWLDSFIDDSGIDLNSRGNFSIWDGEVKPIKKGPPFQVDSNTVALWHLDEGSGTIAYDATTNNYDATLGGDGLGTDLPTWTTGKCGAALSFDGVDDYLTVPETDDFSLDTTGVLTVEFFIKTGSDITTRQEIICKGGQVTSGPWEWTIRINGGKFNANICDIRGWNIRRESVDVSPNTWYYFVVIYNGYIKDDDIEIYQYCMDKSILSNQVNLPYSNTNSELGIGRIFASGSWHYFSGIIDAIRISNIARRPASYSMNLTSVPINITPRMTWDTLIINKTQPSKKFLNITILNATDNSTIPGSPVYVNDGEFDISYIDPVKYPSIRLRGNFVRNCTTTPVLHYWGVSWNSTSAWRDSLFGGSKGTTLNLTKGDGEIWMSTSPNDWFKVSTNPIFTPSSSGWDSSAVHSPYVRFNGTGYTMWYSGRVTSLKMEIGVAFSSDGVTWTRYSGNPVLSTSTSGWENRFINYPCVLFDGNNYRMWYTGQDTSGDRRTGYAISSDGLNWQKYSGNPVIDLGSTGQWDDHYAHRPIVNFDGSIYKMWYIGLGGTTGKYQVGYATSYDGINWIRYPSNPIIPSPIGSPLGYGGTCSIFVLPYNNNYLGWYDYGIGAGPPGREIYQIYSNDGLNWITNFINPILKKGASGTWDDTTVVGPRVIFNGKQYLMYYTASDGTTTQVGLAKTKFFNGTLYSESITIPSNKVWDRLIINKSQPYNANLTISILDNSNNIPIKNYTNLKNLTINLSGLDPNIYSSIKLVAYLNSTDRKNTPILHDWSVNWTYSNLIPIAEAGAKQTIYENQVVILNGTSSYDPDGSIVNWSWDINADGLFDLFGPFANYTYNDDSVNNVTLMVTDDQGANDTDYCIITVLNLNATIDNYNITILSAYPGTIGYWKHQCYLVTPPNSNHTGILPEFITAINNNSSIFTSLTSKDDILEILEPEESKNMTAKAKQQLMGLWLNVVSGKLSKGTAINLTNLTSSTTVGAALVEIEQIILNTSSNHSELERVKDTADSINNGIGLITTVTLGLWASDAGSDDIILTIDWNDGSANTTITFFNNAPINTSDPFPSQFGGKAPMNVQAILIHKYNLRGTYLITIKLQDDDNSIFILKINLTI